MCFHQKPLYLLWHLLSPLEIFRCHYVTAAFFQNSPPGIDLSKDTLAPLKSKPSCQHILMAFFGGKTGDISGPGRCRDHACVCSESFGNLLLFIVVPWGQYWIQHHRDISSEPESAVSFHGDLGKVAWSFRNFVSSSVKRRTDCAMKIKLRHI